MEKQQSPTRKCSSCSMFDSPFQKLGDKSIPCYRPWSEGDLSKIKPGKNFPDWLEQGGQQQTPNKLSSSVVRENGPINHINLYTELVIEQMTWTCFIPRIEYWLWKKGCNRMGLINQERGGRSKAFNAWLCICWAMGLVTVKI